MIDLKQGLTFADHYLLKKRLGCGSFGEVWLAYNSIADIDIAIKIYKEWNSGIEDFKEEFKVAYKLSHPNLLHINHFDVYNGCPFLVMPYCANGSAAKLKGNLSEKQLWMFVRDVACGLMHLHNQYPPIIHQDIKPENILIDDNGFFMIADFGISKKLERTYFTQKNMTSSGTIAYMAPECFLESALVVKASDIWSLGMSLCELATNHLLFGPLGGSSLFENTQIQLMENKYSYQMNELIRKCLAYNTWERPTANEIYEYACRMLEDSSRQVILEEKTSVKARMEHSFSSDGSLNGSAKVVGEGQSSVLKEETFYRSSHHQIPMQSSQNNRGGAAVHNRSFFTWSAFGLVLVGIAVSLFSFILNYHSVDEDVKYNMYKHDKNLPKEELKVEKQEIPVRDLVEEDVEERNAVSQPQPTTVNREYQLFSTCQTISDYEAYIRKYPYGKYVNKAKEIIQQKENEERFVFQSCRTVADFNGYKSRYPNGKYLKEANQRLRSLMSSQEEERLFHSCQSVFDFEKYIQKYPNGKYLNDAKKAIRDLERVKIHGY